MAKTSEKAPAYQVGALYSFRVRKLTKLSEPATLKYLPERVYRSDGAILNAIGANIDADSVVLQTETLAAALHADPTADVDSATAE